MRQFLILAFIGAMLFVGAVGLRRPPVPSSPTPSSEDTETRAPEPTEIPFTVYQVPKLPKKTAYTVVFLGDSMTAALGPFADRLRETLKPKYPQVDLIIENQSAPASNIESIQDRLLTKTSQSNVIYEPILDKPFDIIIIESFGYNPLSYLGLTEGLNKQKETLSNAMRILVRERPQALVIFLATIAPSYTQYGVGAVSLTPQQRREWASERSLYIQGHIQFAKDHNIPLVDVYHQTLDPSGNGLSKYINPTDHIHPSAEAVVFIQDELTKYFVESKTFE